MTVIRSFRVDEDNLIELKHICRRLAFEEDRDVTPNGVINDLISSFVTANRVVSSPNTSGGTKN